MGAPAPSEETSGRARCLTRVSEDAFKKRDPLEYNVFSAEYRSASLEGSYTKCRVQTLVKFRTLGKAADSLRELTPIVLKLSGLVVSPRSEGASIRWAGVTTPLSPPNWCRRQRGEAATVA